MARQTATDAVSTTQMEMKTLLEEKDALEIQVQQLKTQLEGDAVEQSKTQETLRDQLQAITEELEKAGQIEQNLQK